MSSSPNVAPALTDDTNSKGWLDPKEVARKGKGKSCFICGKKGHLKYACPELGSIPDGQAAAADFDREKHRQQKKEKDKRRRRERTQRRAEERQRMFANMSKTEREQWFTAKEEKRKQQETKVLGAAKAGAMRVAIDCAYHETHTPRELRSFGQQCSLVYATMRKAADPCALHFCSYTGKVKEQLEKMKAFNWKGVEFHEQSFEDVFGDGMHNGCVYLSPDATDVLTELDKDTGSYEE